MKQVATVKRRSNVFGGMLPLFAITIFVFVAISAMIIKVAWLQTEALMFDKIAGLAAVAAMEAYVKEADPTQKATQAGLAAQSIVDTNFGTLPVQRFATTPSGTAPTISLTLGNWNFPSAPNCTGPCFTTGGTINAAKVAYSTAISSESLFGSFFSDIARSFSADACAAQLPSGPIGLVEQ